jgi:hypothetical protein
MLVYSTEHDTLVYCGCLSARTLHQRLLEAISVQHAGVHELLRNQNDTTTHLLVENEVLAELLARADPVHPAWPQAGQAMRLVSIRLACATLCATGCSGLVG